MFGTKNCLTVRPVRYLLLVRSFSTMNNVLSITRTIMRLRCTISPCKYPASPSHSPSPPPTCQFVRITLFKSVVQNISPISQCNDPVALIESTTLTNFRITGRQQQVAETCSLPLSYDAEGGSPLLSRPSVDSTKELTTRTE